MLQLDTIIEGDSAQILKNIDNDSIDCIVTDPPYALTSKEYKPDKKYSGGFMNKKWDSQLPSIDIWKECLRVLKPGAFAFIMCTPRQDILARQIINLQDAGFETNFTSIYWSYASGFPKAMNIAKNLSKVVDNINNNLRSCHYLNNLRIAKDATNQYQKLFSEVGIPMDSNDFVVVNALENTEVKNKQSNVKTAENQLSVHQVMSKIMYIVVENVGHLQHQFYLNVHIVEKSQEDLNHLHNQTKIIVPENVLIMECEQTLSKIKGEEASKIDIGNVKLLNNLDTNVFYVELIESWKHIILNQLKNSLNSDITSIMDNVSAMSVITTKSIMECLISETVNTLVKRLRENIKQYEGGYAGLQPKPALEIILCVQKPIEEKTFVYQALKNGKGITWLDDCRIPFQNEKDIEVHRRNCEDHTSKQQMFFNTLQNPDFTVPNEKGRFPANLLVEDDSLNDGKITGAGITGSGTAFVTKGKVKFNGKDYNNGEIFTHKVTKKLGYNDKGSHSRYFDLDKWFSQIEAQFIITPKASASERNKGCEDLPKIETPTMGRYQNRIENGKITNPKAPVPKLGNHHPTVKPIKLMSYLITMGSRPNDIILDPFCGSGTTCIAAYQLHRKFIGIEKEHEYVEIAQKRLEPYMKQQKLLNM